ncbi:helix-turn-helix domain-containing protein [Xylophilus rhododendri]
MTQIEISKETGIPQPRLSRWEQGDVARSADDALRLNDLAARRDAESASVAERSSHAAA